LENRENFHFKRPEEIGLLAGYMVRTYPTFISEKLPTLFSQTAAYSEKCACLKDMFHSTVRFLAIICVSYYLRDNDAAPWGPIRQTLSRLVMPTDSTWKDIVVHVSDYYKRNKKDRSFYIEEFEERTDMLSDRLRGYTAAIKGGIRTPDFREASVLQAGIDLRNAVHYDLNRLNESDYEKIWPFYLDMMMTILKAMRFLNGERYMYVCHLEKILFLILHGKGDKTVEIALKDMDDYIRESRFFVFDKHQNRLYPLYPFILRVEKLWNREREFTFEHISGNAAIYTGISGFRLRSKEGYQSIKTLMKKKMTMPDNDMARMNYAGFKSLAVQASRETLENGYLNKIYFPDCHTRRKETEKIIADFLLSDKTALCLTGISGIGKSELMADRVYQMLSDEKLIPVFINARDIKKTDRLANPLFCLICEKFRLKIENSSIETFFAKLHEILLNVFLISDTDQADHEPRVILFIDAESGTCTPGELFAEMDAMVNAVYDSEHKRIKYLWLKIIFTLGSDKIDALRSDRGGEESLFKNEILYFQVSAEGQEGKQTPVAEISPLTAEEARIAFFKYTRDKTVYPVLSRKPPDEAVLNDKLQHLRNPLLLKCCLNLLEKSGKEDTVVVADGERLFEAYYHLLSEDREVRHFLLAICRKTAEESRSREIEAEIVAEIVGMYHKARKTEGFYSDPLEKLVSEGVLEKRLRYSVGDIPEEMIAFTHRKFHEYAMYRFFLSTYGEPSGEVLEKLLNTESDFEIYNNAVTLMMSRLWAEKRIPEMTRLSVTVNPSRYTRVFENAVFDELEEGIKSGWDSPKQKEKAQYYEERLRLLVSDKENLGYIQGIEKIFFRRSGERFHKKDGGLMFYEISSEIALEIFRILNIKNYDYGVCLSRLGGIYESRGETDKAFRCYTERIRLGKELSDMNPNSYNTCLGLVVTYYKAGKICKRNHQVTQAKTYLTSALEILYSLDAQKKLLPKHHKWIDIFQNEADGMENEKWKGSLYDTMER